MTFGTPAETRMTPPPAVGSGVPQRASGSELNEFAPRAPQQAAVAPASDTSSGIELVLSSGERLRVAGRGVIGRDPSAAAGAYVHRIALADTEKLLSRAHLEFGLDGSGVFWVSDLHSTNGALLDRAGQAPQRCLPGYRVVIQPGDRVAFGGRTLTIAAG